MPRPVRILSIDGGGIRGIIPAMVLAELPDNRAAAALSMSAEATGAIRTISTTVLLTVDEAMEAMKQAQTDEYKPPS